jgi:hypothetical protein
MTAVDTVISGNLAMRAESYSTNEVDHAKNLDSHLCRSLRCVHSLARLHYTSYRLGGSSSLYA